MGGIECASERKDNFLWSIIERKLENKDTPLDKKIHNEYLSLMGYNEYHFEDGVKVINNLCRLQRIMRFQIMFLRKQGFHALRSGTIWRSSSHKKGTLEQMYIQMSLR